MPVSEPGPIEVQASGPYRRPSPLRDITARIHGILADMTRIVLEQRLDQVSSQHNDLVRKRMVGQPLWGDIGRRARACLMAQVREVSGKSTHPIGAGALES
ncbi:hypothetical protein [Frankia sp. Cj3]|uniref:hypothetical protein n=1 Tax=Frankia sp. Cj3 TaxID=2880976 RepID=UPI001EF4F921|nr:hypothetical protein [Frankia sp. Cj3]